ncbi:RHS repeat-associated core domain-containing protein, partial [Pseudoalteromonas luteoviolacea]|uniref:RHS repeat-associated core domain-containing protein n=1 Tax=Pseudoalteromonas luteoviolacea TaxID=43657 RepID=UPI000A86E281
EHYVSDHLSGLFGTIPRNLRSYTGHEPVALGDDNRILHMNGRVYDADTGRFMQADPFVQAPENLQNYNAYSYVLNNPLSYTDPSGYLFKKLLKGAMKATGTWQMLRAVGKVPWLNTMITVGLNFIPGCQGWCAAAATAAYSAGSTFAVTGSLNKGLLAGFSAAAMPGGEGIGAIAASAVIGGATSKLMGGNFGHGFFSAGLGAAAGGVGRGIRNPVGQVLVGAIVGGTVSKVTGGKFANGAFSSAFAAALRADWGRKPLNSDSPGAGGALTPEQKTALDKKVNALQGKLDTINDAGGFESVDKAAGWYHDNVHPIAEQYGVEFGSQIFSIEGSDKFYGANIHTDYDSQKLSWWKSTYKGQVEGAVAVWHTHPDGLNFSLGDIMMFQKYEWFKYSYLSGMRPGKPIVPALILRSRTASNIQVCEGKCNFK